MTARKYPRREPLESQIERALRSGFAGYCTDLAAQIGCTHFAVHHWLRRMELTGLAVRDSRLKVVSAKCGSVRKTYADFWRFGREPIKPAEPRPIACRRDVLMRSREHMGPLLTVWQGASA